MYREKDKTYGGTTTDTIWWEYTMSVEGSTFPTDFVEAMDGLARAFVDIEDEKRKVESITINLTDGTKTTLKLLQVAG